MWYDIIALCALLAGTSFGALWSASLEQEKHKDARFYSLAMVHSYFMSLVAIFSTASSTLLAFVYVPVLVVLIVMRIITRLRPRHYHYRHHQQAQESANPKISQNS
jgi:ABC-type antimicrobial peptide transport system permease subunit